MIALFAVLLVTSGLIPTDVWRYSDRNSAFFFILSFPLGNTILVEDDNNSTNFMNNQINPFDDFDVVKGRV